MATRKAKPDGQYLLRSEEVDDFIRDQTVTSLPGEALQQHLLAAHTPHTHHTPTTHTSHTQLLCN